MPASKDSGVGRLARFGNGFVPGALLVALTALVYLPVLDALYIWDDDAYVIDNANLRTVGGLVRSWVKPDASPQYYPLVFTTFWVEYHLWGLSMAGYHAVNVLLHGLSAVMIWRLLRRLEVPGAWVAAAIFAVHPVHVESVAWITELKNVLSTACYLAAMLAYFRAAPPDAKTSGVEAGRARWYALALALYVCALWSKTVTCSLPVAILLVRWWKAGRIGWRDVRPLLPFFAVGLYLGLQTAWLEKNHVGAKGFEWNLSFVDRCLIAGRALWFYAGKLVWPSPKTLIFIYPRWRIDAKDVVAYLYPTGALAVLVGLWAARGRIGRGPFAAVAFFAVTLVPALGFFDTYPMRYSFVADHFQYLASVGVIALLAALGTLAFQRVPPERRRLVPVAVGVLLAAFGTITVGRTFVYSTSWTLWTDTLEKNPTCWMAHNNLGALLLRENKIEEAEQHFATAVQEYPDCAEALVSLGFVREERGRLDEADALLRRALRLSPAYWQAHFNLGLVDRKRGDLQAAIRDFREALRYNSNSAEAHAFLAMSLAESGRPEEAAPYFKKLGEFLSGPVMLSPFSGRIFNRAAWMLATSDDPRTRNGRLAEAIASKISESIRADDDGKPVYLDTLAAAYAEEGRFDEAVATARRAMELASLEDHPGLSSQIQRRLDAYEKRRPIRQ